MLDLQRQYLQVREEVLAAIEKVCASQHYILGAEVEELEREIATLCGAVDAVGCASGTDALWLALAAAGVQPGDPVLTTPFSFFASASSIVRAGARPVFADIDPRTSNLDPAKVESFLRSSPHDKLRVVLPVHLYGQCADMDRLQQIAEEFHLSVIEDAAQAIGARWASESGKSRSAGSMGVSAAFSFYPTKNLSAYGDAGLVATSDPEWRRTCADCAITAARAVMFTKSLDGIALIDVMQAAILRVKLKYVAGWNDARRQRAATYASAVCPGRTFGSGNLRGENASPIQLPPTAQQAHHVFHQYVVRAYRRDELREFLTARKIGTEIYYPIPAASSTLLRVSRAPQR